MKRIKGKILVLLLLFSPLMADDHFLPVENGDIVLIMPLLDHGDSWTAEVEILLYPAETGLFDELVGQNADRLQLVVPVYGVKSYEVPFDGGLIILSTHQLEVKVKNKEVQ